MRVNKSDLVPPEYNAGTMKQCISTVQTMTSITTTASLVLFVDDGKSAFKLSCTFLLEQFEILGLDMKPLPHSCTTSSPRKMREQQHVPYSGNPSDQMWQAKVKG